MGVGRVRQHDRRIGEQQLQAARNRLPWQRWRRFQRRRTQEGVEVKRDAVHHVRR